MYDRRGVAFRPEDKARENIDNLLTQAGWILQDHSDLNLAAGQGIAVREFPLKKGHGSADYLLYVNKKAVGVIEAKKEGDTLTGVEVQTEKYSNGLPDHLTSVSKPLPYLYQSTGIETRFTNARDPNAASRNVFTFLRPESIAQELGQLALSQGIGGSRANYDDKTLLGRLQCMPELITTGMRDCQVRAVTNLEKSLAENRRRSLIQMQTGSGKTYTAVAQAYRLIKFGGAKRIVFLVDRGNLAEQTLREFQAYVTPDDGRKFTELYNVQWLQSNKIDPVAKVVITTIQRLYSILKGEEEFDEANEKESVAGLQALIKKPQDVVYNANIPIEMFDFVFTDECHRSIYNLWRQVLEYFDAYLIGLTATPSKQTLGYFNQNLVMEYDHSQAVADGVNVDFDVYRIQTRITDQGSTVEAGNYVDRRDRKSRKTRWQELEDDLSYAPNDLDRAVVAEDQIRTIIQTFRDRLFTEIFPGRSVVPKTLIFAKDDNHADDIVKILREEFGKGNEFCEKITYRTGTARIVDEVTGETTGYKSSGIKPEDLLKSFQNGYNPRVAVTVDMIATGTDVKPLEIVFFMRDVQSSNYFEQMKGRGCRVIDSSDFEGITPGAKNKTRYVIIDAVGVTEHCKKDSPQLDRQPTVPLKTILQAVGQGSTDPDIVSTLASRLARLDRIIGDGQRQEVEAICGQPLSELIKSLADSVDPDHVLDYGMSIGLPEDEESAQMVSLAQNMREKAVEPFLNPKLRDHLLFSLQDAEQTIDTVSKDEVVFAGASVEATERARSTIQSFAQYLSDNRDEITAIQLIYQHRRGQGPTLSQLKELAKSIQQPPRQWTPDALWRAYETLEKSKVRGSGGKVVTDLVSLVRFALEQETVLRPFGESVEDRFAAWVSSQQTAGRVFTEEEMKWLSMIRDHVATSLTIEPDDFEVAPFAQAGGLGRAYQVFGERLNPLLAELNEVLVA